MPDPGRPYSPALDLIRGVDVVEGVTVIIDDITGIIGDGDGSTVRRSIRWIERQGERRAHPLSKYLAICSLGVEVLKQLIPYGVRLS